MEHFDQAVASKRQLLYNRSTKTVGGSAVGVVSVVVVVGANANVVCFGAGGIQVGLGLWFGSGRRVPRLLCQEFQRFGENVTVNIWSVESVVPERAGRPLKSLGKKNHLKTVRKS